MFLVQHQRAGASYLVFTHDDPRDDGFSGAVLEGVSLDYDMNVHSWPDGQERPEAVAGQDPANPRHYKVFKYTRDRQASGFHAVPGTVTVHSSWSEYEQLPNS